MTCIICLLGGIQLICLGVIGTYMGKIYLEAKPKPRYIISERTKEENEYNKKPLPHLYNAKVGGASYFNGLPETNILNLCFSTPNLNLSKLK